MQDQLSTEASDRMLTVRRAAADLRRGAFVVVEGMHDASLIQAAETVTGESLAALDSFAGGDGRIALTATRARALDLGPALSPVVTLPLGAGMSADAIRWIADPTVPTGTPPISPGGLQAAGATSSPAGAIGLSKLARLLPAAVCAPLPRVLEDLEGFVANRNLLRVPVGAITEYPSLVTSTLRPVAEARVPLEVAEHARVVGFRPADGSAEHFAILIGRPESHQPALCRIHSECFTGDLLGSLRCDCGPQLQRALAVMAGEGHGVLLYLAQEGRGIGLINKLRAYQLQDTGLDTLDANERLGFEADERDFKVAAAMLRQLGISTVRLMTNNPSKIAGLQSAGVEVSERVAHELPATLHNRSYLEAKAQRAGHLLELMG